MIHWVTALTTKSDNRSLSPKIHMVKVRTDSSYKLPSDISRCAVACTPSHMQINVMKNKGVERWLSGLEHWLFLQRT